MFNIGVEGAFVLGGLAAAWLGAALTGLGGSLLIPLALMAGALIGGLWSLPPAVLRARLGVDEVVTTLMLNFVACRSRVDRQHGPAGQRDGQLGLPADRQRRPSCPASAAAR